jgi:hypothetical protein
LRERRARRWACETCSAKTKGVSRSLDSCPFFWNHEGIQHRHPDGSPDCTWHGHRTCDRCWIEREFSLGRQQPRWVEQAEPQEPFNRFPRPENAKPQVDVTEKAKVVEAL